MSTTAAEDSSVVPLAPDPPQASDQRNMRNPRFLSRNDPMHPVLLQLVKQSSATVDTEKYGGNLPEPYRPEFIESFYDSSEDEESGITDIKREGERQWNPFWFFLSGIVLGGIFSLAAILPLCTWKTDTAEGQRNRSYYVRGFFIGIVIFVAALLTTVLVLMNVDS